MAFVNGMKCRECGREYPADPLNVCDFCFGPLEVVYDYATISEVTSRDRISRGPLSIWRYSDLLPANNCDPVDIQAGFTPLIKARNLGKKLGLRNLYIKNDSVNPSFSFKDRVVSVAATKAVEFGFDTLACASTGNLACSVAAHAARAGIRAVVFIPSDLEQGKITGAAVYGPTVVAVDGTYDEVNRLCSEIADNYPWLSSTSTCAPTTPRAARPWATRWRSNWTGGSPTTWLFPLPRAPCLPRYGRALTSWPAWACSTGSSPHPLARTRLMCTIPPYPPGCT